MNALKNSVRLIGRLGGQPELKELDGGKKLATFSIATNDSYKNEEGEKVESTEWHHVVAWGKLAEIASDYLQKGQEIAVEGKLSHRSYEDKDVIKRFVTEVVANELLMLSK